MHISFTPMVLDLDIPHKVGCTGYALGFMSLDKEVSLLTWGEGATATPSPLRGTLPPQPRDHQ